MLVREINTVVNTSYVVRLDYLLCYEILAELINFCLFQRFSIRVCAILEHENISLPTE